MLLQAAGEHNLLHFYCRCGQKRKKLSTPNFCAVRSQVKAWIELPCCTQFNNEAMSVNAMFAYKLAWTQELFSIGIYHSSQMERETSNRLYIKNFITKATQHLVGVNTYSKLTE